MPTKSAWLIIIAAVVVGAIAGLLIPGLMVGVGIAIGAGVGVAIVGGQAVRRSDRKP